LNERVDEKQSFFIFFISAIIPIAQLLQATIMRNLEHCDGFMEAVMFTDDPLLKSIFALDAIEFFESLLKKIENFLLFSTDCQVMIDVKTSLQAAVDHLQTHLN
jgi:hypothetical protein